MRMINQKTIQNLDDLRKLDFSIASVIASFAREKCVFCRHHDVCPEERKSAELHNTKHDYCEDFSIDPYLCQMRVFTPKPETPLLTAEKIKGLISNASNVNRLRAHRQKCGCYHCMTVFHSDEIDPENLYASAGHPACCVCEYCGIDSVICEDDLASIAPLNEDTLKQIYDFAFNI